MEDKLYKVSKAHTRYKNADGKIVPGVTTVLSVLNKPALVKWANNLGLQGIDSSKYTDEAARIGTLIHAMVQCNVTGMKLDTSDVTPNQIETAKIGFNKFLKWEEGRKLTTIMSEQPLVSEEYQYGGTIDWLVKDGEAIVLIDFKSGKDIYPEMFCQVAAYKKLLEEQEIHVNEVRILRIGRNEEEGFEERCIPPHDVQYYFDIFVSCKNIYDTKKRIAWF